jgi:hypothetical protein
MKFLAVLLLLALSGCASVHPAYIVKVNDEIKPSIVETTYHQTCAILTEYKCPERIPVALSALLIDQSSWGLYLGGNVVFIDRGLWNPQWGTFGRAVLAHELAHYIIHQNEEDVKNPQTSGCKHEAIAWRVFNAMVVAEGRDDLIIHPWQDRYRGCREGVDYEGE